VAVATTFYRPVVGGAEAAAERLASFLHRRGHRVTVFTKRTNESLPWKDTIDGIEVQRLGPTGERTGRGKWQVIPALRRALVERRQDIDVVCCIDYRGIGLAALSARRKTGAPVIFQAQTEGVLSGARVRSWFGKVGANPEGPTARLATWPIRAMYRRADAIACISRGIEREVLAEGVPRERVHYLPNPVDTRRFAPPSASDRQALRSTLGVAPTAVVCAFVGRLSKEKGVMELVQAWAQARPAAQLVVVGPPMTDHPWDVSRQAQEFVTSHGLADQVRFVGAQPPDQVAAWLRASDFAAQPSHFEAMGLAAAEAMASGLPVIATDTGGYRDFVAPNETGLLVPVGDISALAAAITTLAGDPALRARLGRQARVRAEAFDETVILEQFAQLIDRLAAGRLAART
jgi:glycosyltransferase involved in cell wall biosynthesis